MGCPNPAFVHDTIVEQGCLYVSQTFWGGSVDVSDNASSCFVRYNKPRGVVGDSPLMPREEAEKTADLLAKAGVSARIVEATWVPSAPQRELSDAPST